jgi:ABC-type phosphate transport system substrate-binding protein
MKPRTVVGLLGAACLLMLAHRSDADGFVVLVNSANPTASLSRSELKKAVTGGTKQWSNGAVVQLGVIPGDAPETQYLGSLTDMSSRELLSRIQEQVFKGEMRRPVAMHSSADCIALVRASPGAICVASASAGVPAEAHAVAIQ